MLPPTVSCNMEGNVWCSLGSAPARVHWLWCMLVLVSLSGCSPPYHFRYQYAMVAQDGSGDGIDNERVRVRVALHCLRSVCCNSP